ncbi:MAG: hypothetical protein JJE30_08585 [Desulfuromonadales bacterium]|nr:hypothetical protein [Desulfuromonadales bacterium]
MDLFGKQARQELEYLQEKVVALKEYGSRSLLDLGEIYCKSACAVHISPLSWSIE